MKCSSPQDSAQNSEIMTALDVHLRPGVYLFCCISPARKTGYNFSNMVDDIILHSQVDIF